MSMEGKTCPVISAFYELNNCQEAHERTEVLWEQT